MRLGGSVGVGLVLLVRWGGIGCDVGGGNDLGLYLVLSGCRSA